MNIFNFGLPIIGIANGPIVEADLPDFHFLVSCFADLMGGAALDELNGFFKTCCWAWSQNEVEMVGHDDEFVEEIGVKVTIVEQCVNQDFGIFGDLEDRATLPAFCSDKV